MISGIFNLESVFAPLPRTKRATSVVLHGDPKGRNLLYTVGRSVIIRDVEVWVPISHYVYAGGGGEQGSFQRHMMLQACVAAIQKRLHVTFVKLFLFQMD